MFFWGPSTFFKKKFLQISFKIKRLIDNHENSKKKTKKRTKIENMRKKTTADLEHNQFQEFLYTFIPFFISWVYSWFEIRYFCNFFNQEKDDDEN